MSSPLLLDDILFFQRLLCADGFYKGKLDGSWGPKTEKAVSQFESKTAEIKAVTRSFDIRSENCICTLSVKAQREARLFLGRILDGGFNARIISGTRTYEQQNALFRQGRFGNPGPVITKARGGQSNHNFGVAWDIGIFTSKGGYLADGKEYDQVAKLGQSASVEWGGSWKSFPDRPHYQLILGKSVSELRVAYEEGTIRYA